MSGGGTVEDRQVGDLARAAGELMQAGRLDEASRVWERVLGLAPNHPKALLHLGQHQLYRKNALGARTLLERAVQADPGNPVVTLNLSFVLRALGDVHGEMAALTRTLTIDPHYLPALLAKGALFERVGKHRQAAKVYTDVVTVAPTDDHVEPWLTKPLEHARTVVRDNRARFDAHLGDRLASARANHTAEALERFDECKDVMIGFKKIYTHQPTMLHFPRLPAIAFYDNRDFPWLAEIEAATDVIRGELLALLNEDAGDFAPYVHHPDGVPLNQWAELNHSPKWSAYFLWKDGERVAEHCARCPKTASVLEKMPMVDVPGAAPSAFFSVLQPKTLIPPHTGVTNTRLVMHLPLILQEDCWFRVGNEKREWQMGQGWIFDDTIEHEAWNGSDKTRVILIFDIWNPYLTQAERELVCELFTAMREYYAQD
jgi:aspartyl/asparaginyl beta-hydroxylase (cupin superfamily)